MDNTVKNITTFKPLSRGRYKCNQTGQIVKKSQTKALRNSRANNGINKKAAAVEDIFIKECENLNNSKNWQSILKFMAEGGGKGKKEKLRNIDFKKIEERVKELAKRLS